MKMQKLFFVSVLILTAVFCFSGTAKAADWCHDFNNDIKYATSGSEVGALQTALQKGGFLSAGSAELGQSYFGDATAIAVIAFQKKYASEILTPYGLTKGTGYAGATTRAKLNVLYGCTRSASGVSSLAAGTPTVIITLPNGGEQLAQGATQTISWTSTGFASNAKAIIRFLNSSGISLSTIVTNLPDTGSYAWTVPVRTGNFKIGVMVVSSTGGRLSQAQDTSDDVFSISVPAARAVNLTSPKTGDVMFTGRTWPVTWTATGFASTAKVSLYLWDASYNRTTIATNLPNTSSYSWTTPATAGTYKMSITISDGTNPSMTFTSNSFTVNTAPTTQPIITSVSPNSGPIAGGTVITIYGNGFSSGNVVTIGTTPTGSGDAVATNINVSSDGTKITATTPVGTVGPANVTVATSVQNIKAILYSGFIYTSSTQPSITVTSPNGGETWTIGQQVTVNWSHAGLPNTGYKVFLFKDAVSYIQLATSSTGDSVTWSAVTGLPGTRFKIQVVYTLSDGTTVSDFSDNYFSIVANYDACRLDKLDGTNITKNAIYDQATCLSTLCDVYGPANLSQMSSKCVFNGVEIKRYTQTSQPSITVTSPNGGETWKVGETHNITWISQNLPSSETLDISIASGSNPGSWVATNVPNTGSYSWIIPSSLTAANNYFINVQDYFNGQYAADNSSSFTIAAAASCAPVWSCGAWSACASGQQARTCTDANNCGTTTGKPAVTQTCSTAPAVSVVSPNGGESWRVGTSQIVRWNSANFPTNSLAVINLLNTYGIAVRNIAINISNTGSYTWTVPNLPGTYKVGVMVTGIVSGVFKTASDTSDATFSIASATTGFTDAENNQLASIADALAQIIQQLQALMNK